MFTGLVQACLPVRAFEPLEGGARLILPAPVTTEDTGGPWRPAIGESIAVSGACLTVVELVRPGTREPWHDPAADLVFDLSQETLDRTWMGELSAGRRVNLERSLRMGDRLGGHMVSGHVDGRGTVRAIEREGDGGWRFTFEVEADYERYLIDKGSVALDGISLTVIEPQDGRFDVAVIPHTFAETSLGTAQVGQPVNVEVDGVAKWIERLLPAYGVGR
ncbi:riboflavin synthase [Engelhardtia mirabilis]|uniref:Riboflavin synthase n=1 Tax=Engelhardtia mirabilis TaxID=2528011 RepID=A0A518BPG6_9BACT|nr:Riboflavin synthase [Planctomycetes bacterium Pla133]QDV03198.1 Riboflavin synthase [Planctomycetes bacterium Pla86]